MRILVLSDLYPPLSLGGHEMILCHIANLLKDKGHEIFVLTSDYLVDEDIKEDKVFRKLHYINFSNLQGIKLRIAQLRAIFLRRSNFKISNNIIKNINPDVIFAGQVANISISSLKVAKKMEIPVVYHVGNYYFEEIIIKSFIQKNLFKRFFQKIITGYYTKQSFDFKNVFAMSPSVLKRHTSVGVSKSELSVIPPVGFNLEKVRLAVPKQLKPEKNIKIIFAGRLVEEKGVDVAIKCMGILFHELKIKHISLDIFGTGEEKYEKHLKDLIRKLNIGECVSLNGWCDHTELLEKYQYYDISVVPSLWEEPFGMVFIEAMSKGVVVIASKVGGMKDNIQDRITGCLVPPGNARKIADVILMLMNDHDLYHQISVNCINYIIRDYDESKIFAEIEQKLISVVD